MNSICKHLEEQLAVQKVTQIAKICRIDDRVELINDADLSIGVFDRVVLSIPSGQAGKLVAAFSELSRQVSEIEMNPCWATMASFAEPITDQWVGAFIHDSFLS